jgi:tetratricopeptide (TPR) repeat protein
LEHDGEPAELAHHYLRAGAWRPALENLMRAGRKAEESYAWDSALKIYARALEVVEKLPDFEERQFELLEAQEELLEHMDRREVRARAARKMFELANRLGDLGRLAEAHVRRIGALAALSDPAAAQEAGRVAIAIFQELGDKAGEARAYRDSSG